MPDRMHQFDPEAGRLWDLVVDAGRQRREGRGPLHDARPGPELAAALAGAIGPGGIGVDRAVALFREVIAPACIAADHPMNVAYIGNAPTEAAIAGDLLLSAFPIYGGDWMEGAGVIQAENDALRWLARCAGFPEGAGGCFVQGGTIGNISALHAARFSATRARGGDRPHRWAMIASSEAHSSIKAAANLMDVDIIPAELGPDARLHGDAVRRALDLGGDRVFAVVATGGTTNLGLVDHLDDIADACEEAGVWLHVDGAYGLAGIVSPAQRPRFRGLERADSFVVDPHKWLFSTYDACAVVYRDPEVAGLAHTQFASYLDALHAGGEWNAFDYGVHLTRRARGFPFWFSLAVNGEEAYARAIDQCVELARGVADAIREREWLELVIDPELGIVAFRRRGWDRAQALGWCTWLREQGIGFVMPSVHLGESILRFSLIKPYADLTALVAMLDTAKDWAASA